MKIKITAFGDDYELDLVVAKYASNPTQRSIQAFVVSSSDPSSIRGELFGTITTCVPEERIHSGEIIAKTWSESTWVLQLLAAYPDVFKDTGRRVRCGYVEGQIWDCNLFE